METALAILAALGLKAKVVAASAIGSAISLTFFDNLNRLEKLLTFFGGWALASYTTGAAAVVFELKSEATEIGVAALLGLFSMSLAAAIIKVIKETQWAEIIKARIGGEK